MLLTVGSRFNGALAQRVVDLLRSELQKLVFHNSDLNHTLYNFINIDAVFAAARSL
jgi:hypothetical protein